MQPEYTMPKSSKLSGSSKSSGLSKLAKPSITAKRATRALEKVVVALNGEPVRRPADRCGEPPHSEVPSRHARPGEVSVVGAMPDGKVFMANGKGAVEDSLRERFRPMSESAAPYRHGIYPADAVDGPRDALFVRDTRRLKLRGDRLSDRSGRAVSTSQPQHHERATDAAVFGLARMVPAGGGRVELLLRLVQTRPMYALDGHLEMCEVEGFWRIPAAQVDQHADKDCFALLFEALDAAFLRLGVGHRR